MIQPVDAVLSLADVAAKKKELLSGYHPATSRLLPQEHFDRLPRVLEPPLLVAGTRNVLCNLRCIGYTKTPHPSQGSSPAFAAVHEESDLVRRPYHALRYAQGRFWIDEYSPSGPLRASTADLAETDWLITGTPVYWDCDSEELFDRMITDAADHSHVWQLHRGNHPRANDLSRQQWSHLHAAFTETLSSDRLTAASRLRELAERYQLVREDNYLHSVWGVNDDHQLVIVIAHGRLEEVGQLAAQLGCRRAICVENSGSVGLYSVNDPHVRPWPPLISAPNFRQAGTTFVFFRLPEKGFSVLEQPSL